MNSPIHVGTSGNGAIALGISAGSRRGSEVYPVNPK